jgi:peptidoglycan/xylan/chitin deacetylase (PgdA/CDA1 family)
MFKGAIPKLTLSRAALGALLLLVAGASPGCGWLRVAAAGAGTARRFLPGQVVWRVGTSRKVVALTVDDGPDPKYTPSVLRIAQERKVKLTFFLLGREVEKHADLVRQEISQGHAIGNHGWDHRLLTDRDERESMFQIQRCQDAIEKACKVHTDLFRPPKGVWDSETSVSAESMGYRMVLWTTTLEHRTARTSQEMADRVISRVSPGTIILAHDGEPKPPIDRRRTIAALPLLIDGLRKKGYEFVTVPELLELSR